MSAGKRLLSSWPPSSTVSIPTELNHEVAIAFLEAKRLATKWIYRDRIQISWDQLGQTVQPQHLPVESGSAPGLTAVSSGLAADRLGNFAAGGSANLAGLIRLICLNF